MQRFGLNEWQNKNWGKIVRKQVLLKTTEEVVDNHDLKRHGVKRKEEIFYIFNLHDISSWCNY